MEMLIIASIIIIGIMLDWWDKNNRKIDMFFDRLPDLIRLKLKNLYSKLRRQ